MGQKPKIVLVTGLWDKKNRSLFEHGLRLISALEPSSSQITWVATNLPTEATLNNEAALIKIETRFVNVEEPCLSLFFHVVLHQAKIILAMLRATKFSEVDIFFFAYGADFFIFPMLLGRLAGKKVIIRSDGRPSFVVREYFQKPSKTKIVLLGMIERTTYSLATKIAPEVKYMVNLYCLQEYSDKISDGALYIDTLTFKKTKGLAERTYGVGYVGRFCETKGVLEFVKALPLVMPNKAIMIGDGELADEVKEILAKNNIQGEVELPGWVKHEELPLYLNNIRLIVIPSYYEGLPNLVLEAMACGTPVLATPVGGIPEVVRDGETGFIMEDNSPECIAKNVTRALSYPGLEKITRNAWELIKGGYSYEAAVERFRNILESLE